MSAVVIVVIFFKLYHILQRKIEGWEGNTEIIIIIGFIVVFVCVLYCVLSIPMCNVSLLQRRFLYN